MSDPGLTRPDLCSISAVIEQPERAQRDLLSVRHVYGYLNRQRDTGMLLLANHHARRMEAGR
jgi:hypothetical protein